MRKRTIGLIGVFILLFGLILLFTADRSDAQTSERAHRATVGYDTVTCTYDNPGITPVYGNYKIDDTNLSWGQYDTTGKINDPTHTRWWDWKMKHNDSYSAGGTTQGDATINRIMADMSGTDWFEFRFENAAHTILCKTVIYVQP